MQLLNVADGRLSELNRLVCVVETVIGPSSVHQRFFKASVSSTFFYELLINYMYTLVKPTGDGCLQGVVGIVSFDACKLAEMTYCQG